ncbi:MAG TPA: type I glutamate--ammonia ligase [Polyangiaceae bacterium LLY-WYZ-15_(1-7)]|nr:type I glutamate--ammonia ligase [Sandaracinus sp.]HJL04550.1 type I glutamate--ammonia ligase [Polyangiaceae bacterium LLY-WYZ-15_(1-7)]HJL07332.1 type I glutamate--ammonia ligase [Polyangiaceae bacterium LLY-WYZ-15_(1-7)]HJL27219.1 type I glutamate--ammonia ligase [Polyangiaceae bacterium LLY-WYZ-15_(1-7)]HJL27935.1 type I glutamate--ammonia ligase [Polyangiaceae bacterium LLY-WYZ-15_(1-7)]
MSDINTPKDVLELAKAKGAVMADLRFIDLPGVWQHTSVPIHRLEESSFEDGFGFDGSSIRGYQPINASDMLIIPDASTAKMDPFTQHPTLVLTCDIVDPITREPYARDPRYVARKAAAYLKQTGIADTAYFGPEAEFFVFDDVQYGSQPNAQFYQVDSIEAIWNTSTDEGPNLGYKIPHKGGYFPVMPTDTLMDLRTEMCLILQQLGYEVEVSHHEVATAGQCEIDVKFEDLLSMGDHVMWFKYVVKNAARRAGKVATFMPKPMHGDNGSGMHCHQSLWKDGKPLFAGDGYAGMSEMALHYIGGILKHARAICALSNPTINSYRRLVPGFEAPVNLAYSSRNRSASIRIPTYSQSPKAKRLEARFPDSSGNPYLAFSAMLMAGLDGIQNKIDPGDPFDKDLYSLSPEELAHVPTVPGSLEEALDCLEEDHEFLLKGDVFTKDIIDEWISFKRENEIAPFKLRPTPLEYELYFAT